MSDDDFIKNAERNAKQHFLKEEIVDAGLDPGEFIAFCAGDEEPDIDSWSFEELQDLVRQFKDHLRQQEIEAKKAAKRPKKPAPVQQPETVEVEEEQQIDQSPKKNLVIEIEDHPEEDSPPALQDDEEELKIEKIARKASLIEPPKAVLSSKDIQPKYTIPGVMLPETELSANNYELEVRLSEPVIKKGGMFSSSYAEFDVTTNPLGWSVKRQFADFAWLRQSLAIVHPDYIVPVLPKEVNQGALNQELPKRRTFLQRFINAIVFTPIFQQSTFVVAFLKEANPKEWIKEKKLSSKSKKPTDLGQIATITGEIPINPENPPRPFMDAVNAYITQTQTAGKVLKRSTGALFNDLEKLSNSLKEIANQIRALRDVHDLIPDAAPQKKMFNKVAEVLDQWSLFEKHQIKNVNLYLTTFFKFYYKQPVCMMTIFKERESRFGPYSKAAEKLKIDKEKLWATKAFGKWGFKPTEEDKANKELSLEKMLPKETNNMQKLENMFGYYNYQAFSELTRKLDYDEHVYTSHFAQFSQVQQEALQNMTQIYQNLEAMMNQAEEL